MMIMNSISFSPKELANRLLMNLIISLPGFALLIVFCSGIIHIHNDVMIGVC